MIYEGPHHKLQEVLMNDHIKTERNAMLWPSVWYEVMYNPIPPSSSSSSMQILVWVRPDPETP